MLAKFVYKTIKYYHAMPMPLHLVLLDQNLHLVHSMHENTILYASTSILKRKEVNISNIRMFSKCYRYVSGHERFTTLCVLIGINERIGSLILCRCITALDKVYYKDL